MDEFGGYLRLLLDHDCVPEGPCPECLRLERIYQLLQAQIFATVVYPEMIAAARPLETAKADAEPLSSAYWVG